jgi:hypothetical protein
MKTIEITRTESEGRSMDFRDNTGRGRLVEEGEVVDLDEVRRGVLRLPDPPEPRPEPPVEEQDEKWARLTDLPRRHPIRNWARERLGD